MSRDPERRVQRRRTALLVVLMGLARGAAAGHEVEDVPWIDLDGEAALQSVVDREEGQYLGHPTTALLVDGRTILAVYPKGHGRGAICLKRSEDGGRSWSSRLPVPENWSTSQETPTIHRVPVPGGGERLILFSGLHPIRMASSEDEGRTWTPLEPIGDYGGIVAMAAVEAMADGSLLAFFHDDGRFLRASGRPEGQPPRFRVFAVRSGDGGLSWDQPRTIVEHPLAHLCEPGFFRSPDGSRIVLLLRENSRRFRSMFVLSADEGRTWSEPEQLAMAVTGDRHAGVALPDGRLFVSFRDMAQGSPTWGDWVAWVGTFEDLVAGRDGQYRLRLKDNLVRADCGYPGVLRLPDGTIVATSYGHWEEGAAPYVLSIRLSMQELDERARRQGASNPLQEEEGSRMGR